MQITILDHRAFWCKDFSCFENKQEQNSINAFKNSFQQNRGVETDLRDLNGNLVISHDLPFNQNILAEQVFKLYKQLNCNAKLALNIKADGLQSKLKELLEKYEISNYFVFDMSVPDCLHYADSNINFYIRSSEHEVNPKLSSPLLYKKAKGVWFDQFKEESESNLQSIRHFLQDGKELCIVSPELHAWGRVNGNYIKYWKLYKNIFTELKKEELSKVSLCTDLPLQAKDFFNSNLNH